MTPLPARIRPASIDDAAGVGAIYRPIVAETTISFETEPPDDAEIAQRIDSVSASHAWLVAEVGGQVAGYAYGTGHRARQAYRYSTETSVYVHPEHHGRGLASALYQALFARLAELGYFQAYAGITLPNAASTAAHASAGFRHIGTFPRVGYKFGGWHDVSWWYRPLRDDQPQAAS